MEESTEARHEAFMRAFQACQPSLRAYVLSIVGDLHLAEDVLQETAIGAWRQYGAYDPTRPFVGWVLGIARNKSVDALRARRSGQILPGDLVDQLSQDAATLSEEMATRRRVLSECLGKLTEQARTVFRLRVGAGLKVDEIARREGRTTEAIRRMLSRTRAFLAGCTGHALSQET